MLAEVDGATQRNYAYGNGLDEVLCRMDNGTADYYMAHDHLNSIVALLNSAGAVVERYEYDAYGARRRYNANFGTPTDDLKNTIAFTGQRLDTLDGGALAVMYYKNRFYDPDTGRFLSRDPLGITPGVAQENPFEPIGQYTDGMDAYEYVVSNPLSRNDIYGLSWLTCTKDSCGPWKWAGKPYWTFRGAYVRQPRDISSLAKMELAKTGRWGAVLATMACAFKILGVDRQDYVSFPQANTRVGGKCWCLYIKKQKCRRCCTQTLPGDAVPDMLGGGWVPTTRTRSYVEFDELDEPLYQEEEVKSIDGTKNSNPDNLYCPCAVFGRTSLPEPTPICPDKSL